MNEKMKVFQQKNFHFLCLFTLLEYHTVLMAFLHGMNSFFYENHSLHIHRRRGIRRTSRPGTAERCCG